MQQFNQIAGIGRYAPQSARDVEMWHRLETFCAQQPRAFDRDPALGHVTASAFVLSPDRSAALMTHHAKLDRWLQLGGHCDGIADAAFVAQKEAYEESGLSRLRLITPQVFDVDIHLIPARGAAPAHLHYDVRYLFVADAGEIKASAESHALAWVALGEVAALAQADSVLVMVQKLPDFLARYEAKACAC